MLIALLTDVHANREALAACLAHAERLKAERYAFLGDLVGYGANPGWVLDTVMSFVERGAIGARHDAVARETILVMQLPTQDIAGLDTEQAAAIRGDEDEGADGQNTASRVERSGVTDRGASGQGHEARE